MKTMIYVIMFVLGMVAVGCTQTTTPVTIKFEWTAVGDNGNEGTATSYDFRYSVDSAQLQNNWDSCTQLTGLPAPSPAGTLESFTTVISLLPETDYYFVIKACDEVPNCGLTGNTLHLITPDNIPPGTILTLRFTLMP